MSKISISNANLDGARKIRSQLMSMIGSPLSSLVSDRIVVSTVQEGLDDLGYGSALNVYKYGYDGYWGNSSIAALSEFCQDHLKTNNLSEAFIEVCQLIVESIKPEIDKFEVVSRTYDDLLVESYEREGRQRVRVSNGKVDKEFTKFRKGYYTNGTLEVNTGDRIIDAVAPIEGRMDAINTWDDSFLSIGPFQWTLGQGASKGELVDLIHEFKVNHYYEFEEYLGKYGIDVGSPSNEQSLVLHGKFCDTTARKDTFRSPKYCFVFWNLCHCPQFQKVLADNMNRRIVEVKSVSLSKELNIGEVINDDYCIAQLLQSHINRPAYVDDYVRLALDKVMAVSVSDLVGEEIPCTLQRRIIVEVEGVAMSYGKYPMTHAAKRFQQVRDAFNI